MLPYQMRRRITASRAECDAGTRAEGAGLRSPTAAPPPPSKPEGDVDAAWKGQSNSQAVVSMSRLTPCPQIRHFGAPPPFTPHHSATPGEGRLCPYVAKGVPNPNLKSL